MRIHSLILLSVLLATQVITEKVKHGAKKRQSSIPDEDPSVPLGKSQNKQRSRTSKATVNGKFVTKDQEAPCTWAVTEQQQPGVMVKVECTQAKPSFSCVFGGNPTECLKFNHGKVYWKQIARTLRKQKNICGNAKSVLKAKVCKKNFPESNLKLVNSTLLRNIKPKKAESELSPREHTKIKGASSQEPHQADEDIHSSSAVTPTVTPKKPTCAEDPDVVNQRNTALEFCGEAWSSFCTFFLNMIQATSC
ncbi:fibroblast growth factor-binding protein 1-like [Ctenodactylus gundi]